MALNNMTYTHFQHRHKFAVWCAARAVQRKFAKTPYLKAALEKSGVVEFIKDNKGENISQQDFDRFHEGWCEAIIQSWQKNKIKGVLYGRAAKLLAVYIKSMVVVQNNQSKLSDVAHPPINRMILHNMSKDRRIQHPNRTDWKKINWTQLNKPEYKNLINDFRQVFGGQPLWVIEKYWPITDY